ncbi:LOG family protein ORF6 in fasciation locus [Nonomuraea coxensis DSM 45129]|uniref:Cytokinin riboside 5'-monophosphate phosphoribohydrolase n=1 Tax=Nonomuraea coxensis DSM 45129 TaxID=1122611 RepID=A0ABX8U1M5_9ACTN|nr:TIGR00730 family Rossman fold protein [Nonomuraea coxensis]QYC41595.1 LOG family protein ORF6 in fasciation locus [Nonomuraea coxensis DSM 45129]
MSSTTVEAGLPRGGRGPLEICVFCGAGRCNSPSIVAAARATGSLIGRRGHRLLYGGGGSGLMGEVAWAAAEHGASIRGVIPHFLYERERAIAAPAQELHLTDTLLKRKEHMLRSADVFLALPGGFGTLDEILEVISATYLGVHAKPMIIVNPDGVWDGFIALVETLAGLDLITSPTPVFHTADSPEEAMALAERLTLPVA